MIQMKALLEKNIAKYAKHGGISAFSGEMPSRPLENIILPVCLIWARKLVIVSNQKYELSNSIVYNNKNVKL